MSRLLCVYLLRYAEFVARWRGDDLRGVFVTDLGNVFEAKHVVRFERRWGEFCSYFMQNKYATCS